MGIHLKTFMRNAKEYVEIEARTTVKSIRFVEKFMLFGRIDIVVLVKTIDKKDPEFWVIGGETLMNLYSKKVFKDVDLAFSLHTGITLRLADRQFQKSKEEPKSVGYDAFICHASEDKNRIARPLAVELGRLGFSVWFDEFSLKVGDSLRKNIDMGLRLSRYGVIILSRNFFAKNWPQYELNGLIAREIDGEKVILPIWHNITKKQVMHFSPPLADKVALSTKTLSTKKIARKLGQVINNAQNTKRI